MAEVVDLLDSDEEELALPLAARLAAAGKREAVPHPQASQERAPLAAVHNQKDSSGGAAAATATVAAGGRPNSPTSRPSLAANASLGGADLLRQRQAERAARKAARAAAADGGLPGPPAALGEAAADEEPRPQYHQQEQRQEEQHLGAALGGSSQQAARRGPTRGVGSGSALHKQQAAAWEPPLDSQDASLKLYSQPQRQNSLLDGEDEEWQPPPSSQGARARGGAAAAAAAAGAGQPPAKKGRRPKRTAEEIAQDKANQAREREVRKQMKQANTKKHAVQQVRLLVDASLVSSGGGKGGSLGIGMLNHLDEYNRKLSAAATEEKRINYAVAALDLAPFKALRWQRRQVLGAAAQGAPASQQPDSQASFAAAAAGEGADSVVEEQWDQEPHIMVCFQPQEFIDGVRRDRLASLFSLLERCAAGQRPYLLVCGLARHIDAQERKQHRSDMRAGAMVPAQQSVKPMIEEFLAGLHVECPSLSFRDVVDEAQAAQHVQLITAAIAEGHHRDSDATVFLRAHSKGDSNAMTNMLLDNELDRSLEPFAKSIFAVPLVQPGIAHALAGYYGSLGGLMDMLLDPTRSDADKEGEIKQMERTRKAGGKSGMRVGPAAARQLLQLLRSGDPNLRISSSSKESDE
ncbi:crossover junction endonuclease EME1B-like [Chlorella sorokiniana]|uniref:Crossover junction endonuclease EME1B-like n=1 Tax=Chlorella sorokiniana TaxID=3076 RepID=A0A2P6TUT6_CHLSO|nr:crossover junction endonuclease EME1B-like [Chlorella sorokiniana]|eukprot:PRW57835.1 crossover junction endonuclease EME1B-like [Chlorella sorokiniana]